MTYPPQGPQQGYPGQYGQPAPQGYPPQGYAGPPVPPQGYPQQDQQGAFSFSDVYAGADPAGQLIDEGWYPALVEQPEFGRTSAGDKWCWTIRFRLTTGQYAGRQLTMTLAISPVTQKGEKNTFGMGKMFSQLGAMGVPVGEKFGGPPGSPNFFDQFPVPPGAPPEQQNAAVKAAGDYACQVMNGRPVRIKVTHNEWDGGVNNKVKEIVAAKPGDPTTMPQQAQAAQPVASYQPPGFPQQPPQQAYPQPGPQPVGPGAQPPWGGQGQGQPYSGQPAPGYGQPPMGGPQGQQAPAPYQAPAPPQGPPAPQPQQWQNMAGQPAAGPQQAPAPAGQPGTAQFTPQGQAPQPWAEQAPPNGAPAQQVPPAPPWQQPQAPQQ